MSRRSRLEGAVLDQVRPIHDPGHAVHGGLRVHLEHREVVVEPGAAGSECMGAGAINGTIGR